MTRVSEFKMDQYVLLIKIYIDVIYISYINLQITTAHSTIDLPTSRASKAELGARKIVHDVNENRTRGMWEGSESSGVTYNREGREGLWESLTPQLSGKLI